MKTKFIRIMVLFVFLAVGFSERSLTFAQNIDSDTTEYVPINIDSIEVENSFFKVGEKLTFSIDYGPINAGMATIAVADTLNHMGRKCFQIVSEAYSSKSFSLFFKVEDKVESIIDARGIFSWRIKKDLKEGRYVNKKTYELDYFNNIAYSEDDTVKLTHIVQDALSSLFYVRTHDLKIGKPFFMSHFDNGKFYKLKVNILKKEKIKVKAGIFDTIVVEPLMSSVSVFKHGGRIKVWLTDDEKRMPVKMTTKVKLGSIGLGSIGANLVKYEGFD